MPSGRIAFITERRGGYLRCGRVCPTYTLYDMADDGSDIRCLSYGQAWPLSEDYFLCTYAPYEVRQLGGGTRSICWTDSATTN